EELGQVDWAGAELPERTLQPGEFFIERPLTADKFAERLMAFAFDDVLFIFGLAKGYAQEQAVDVPIGELLRNSRSNLLKIAALTDRDKDHLAIVIKHRISDEWKDIADAFGEPMFDGGAVRLINDGDKPALDWHPDIKDWIEARLYPESGCPALRFPVRINGKSTSLINYFWDCMTKLMYPEIPDSAGPAA
ncbi:MAG TPA: hypothetical protein VFK97_01750, partial [Candidatus Saccharimonadales bacterium]|nr:hypothetical protein [Candidatus Saccharimonadales bacterium]